MKQREMSIYLKAITAGVGILLLVFVFWFFPMVLEEIRPEFAGSQGRRMVCILADISALPAFLCLIRFWGICRSIGEGHAFSGENALRLKRMSQYMLADAVFLTGSFVWFWSTGWYKDAVWLLVFPLLAVFVAVILAVLCAALSHLVQNASELQEEQDLTI